MGWIKCRESPGELLLLFKFMVCYHLMTTFTRLTCRRAHFIVFVLLLRTRFVSCPIFSLLSGMVNWMVVVRSHSIYQAFMKCQFGDEPWQLLAQDREKWKETSS